jgi:hypothetical protein
MAIEPVKIPQNVYVEDRIVGPITLRQLIIVLVSGGFSYAIWSGIKSATGYASLPLTILCWIPAVIGAAFAFVKIQNISLFRLCLLMIEKTEKPVIRRWSPRQGISINFRYFPTKGEKEQKPSTHPHQERIEELSALLDRGPVTEASAEGREEHPVAPPEPPPPAPVDPRRITATSLEEKGDPVDDIRSSNPAETDDHPSPMTPPLIHDILPPSPHAQGSR